MVAARIPPPLRIRVADPKGDLERIVEFQNRFARPAGYMALETVRRFEAQNPQPKRLVLVVDDPAGAVVATGSVGDGGVFALKDGTFRGGLRVVPEQQRRGIGTAMLEAFERHARAHGAPRIQSSAQGDEPEGLRFAERHGYRETNRRYHSYLDVPAFDASGFDDPDAVARRAGVRLGTFAELERELADDVEGLRRQIYDVAVTTGADIPRPEPIQMPPYEAIREMFFGPGSFDRGSSIVAVRDGRVVAVTITDERGPGVKYTNFTGTLREERGRGLALAMKLKAIAALKGQGTRLLGTTNDEQNAAMRGMNAKLGYVPDPPMIELEKRLT